MYKFGVFHLVWSKTFRHFINAISKHLTSSRRFSPSVMRSSIFFIWIITIIYYLTRLTFQADPPMLSLPELVAADPDFVESIREADSFFGPIGFDEKARQINDDKNNQNRISVPAKGGSSSTTASNRTAKRRSSVVKTLNVRRSSRFFRQGKNDSDEMIGSVFQEVTMEVKSFAGASAVSQPQEQPNLGPRNVASSLPTTKKRRSSASRILSAVENLEATWLLERIFDLSKLIYPLSTLAEGGLRLIWVSCGQSTLALVGTHSETKALYPSLWAYKVLNLLYYKSASWSNGRCMYLSALV